MKRTCARLLSALLLLSILCIPQTLAAEAEGWKTLGPMDRPDQRMAVVTVNGKIYRFCGGNTGGVTRIFDPESSQWSGGPDVPNGRNGAAACVVGEKIYVFWTNTWLNFQIYDVKTNTWSPGPKYSEGISGRITSAFIFGEKIYLVLDTHKMYIYDMSTGTWDTSKSIPTAGTYPSICADENNIYVFGATDGKVQYAYNVATATVTELPKMPVVKSGASSIVYQGKIYVTGGQAEGASYAGNSVEIYDIKSGTWSTGPSLNVGRSNHSLAIVDDKLYAFGGTGNLNVEYLTEVLQLPTEAEPDPTPQNPKLAVLLNPGEEVQLSVSDNLSDNAGMTWTSSGAGVATVDANGKVTAIGPGLCEITAKNADGSFNQSIPVRVLPGTADLFRLAVHLTPSQTKRLSMLNDQEGVTWKSLDEAVVTVDPNGQITAAGAGLAIVEATKDDTTQQMYVRVKVA